MKTLREYIDILDEISRRDFLKGAGAAGAALAAPKAAASQTFFTVPVAFNVDTDPPLPRKIKAAWNYFDRKSLSEDSIKTISRLVRLMYVSRMTPDDYRDSQGGRIISNGRPSAIYEKAYDLLVYINDSFKDLPVGNVMNTARKQFEEMQKSNPAEFQKWQEFYFKNWIEFIAAGTMLKQALTK